METNRLGAASQKVKMDKKKAIICDLDSTLCNADHRVHHMKAKKKNYPAFVAGIGNDTPNAWCVALVKAMKESGYEIIYLTGRGEEERKISELWLTAHSPVQDYILLMRKAKDWRKDFIVKKEIYEEQVQPYYDVVFAIDDRFHLAKMFRSIGLPCLHCSGEDLTEMEKRLEDAEAANADYRAAMLNAKALLEDDYYENWDEACDVLGNALSEAGKETLARIAFLEPRVTKLESQLKAANKLILELSGPR